MPMPDNLGLSRACVTFIQRNGQRTLWKNPKPEPQKPSPGFIVHLPDQEKFPGDFCIARTLVHARSKAVFV